MASGNIVHNLGRIRYDREAEPFDWAREFDGIARGLIEAGDHQSLIEYERLGGAALRPALDTHTRPLLAADGLPGLDAARRTRLVPRRGHRPRQRLGWWWRWAYPGMVASVTCMVSLSVPLSTVIDTVSPGLCDEIICAKAESPTMAVPSTAVMTSRA